MQVKNSFKLFFILMNCILYSCEEEKMILLKKWSEPDTKSLFLYSRIRYNGGSSYERFPILYFGDKQVVDSMSDGFHQLPRNPKARKKLILKEYKHKGEVKTQGTGVDMLANDPYGWNVYITPSRFTKSEYETIIRIYEKNEKEFDEILKNSFQLVQNDKKLFFPTDKIVRFIYNEFPPKMELYYDNPQHPKVSLYINDYNHWNLSTGRITHQRETGNEYAAGTLEEVKDEIYLVAERITYNYMYQGKIEYGLDKDLKVKDHSELLQYLKTFQDKNGKKLDENYILDFAILFKEVKIN